MMNNAKTLLYAFLITTSPLLSSCQKPTSLEILSGASSACDKAKISPQLLLQLINEESPWSKETLFELFQHADLMATIEFIAIGRHDVDISADEKIANQAALNMLAQGEMSALCNLKVLTISNCTINAGHMEILQQLRLQNLAICACDGDFWKSHFPATIIELILCDCNLSMVPSQIFDLPLQRLSLSNNNPLAFPGRRPTQAKMLMLTLEELDLRDCGLTRLPACVGWLQKLQKLFLCRNPRLPRFTQLYNTNQQRVTLQWGYDFD